MPSAVFMAQRLVGPSKQIIQIEQYIVTIPNWEEANQLAIDKCDQGFELVATMKQIQVVVIAGLQPRTTGLEIQHTHHSATLAPLGLKLNSLSIMIYDDHMCCSTEVSYKKLWRKNKNLKVEQDSFHIL